MEAHSDALFLSIVTVAEICDGIAKLLGHRRHRTTAGYAHLADGHLVEAAEKVGTIIANAMADAGSDSSVNAGE